MRRLAIGTGAVVLVVLSGLLLDLERAEAWWWFSLLVVVVGVPLTFAALFLADMDKYQKTIWRDWYGRIIRETPWEYVGPSAPIDRETKGGLVGCFVVMPLLFVTICMLIAAVANVSSYLTGYPERYTDQVLNALNLGIPDEAARASHPSGFSMVMPAGWSVEVRSDYLIANSPRRPYEARFSVNECLPRDGFDLSAIFLGRPADLTWDPGLLTNHRDYGVRFARPMDQEILLKVEDTFFCLYFSAPNFIGERGPIRSERSAEVDRYFETFRFERPPAENVEGGPVE